jgi:hypothetical protein
MIGGSKLRHHSARSAPRSYPTRTDDTDLFQHRYLSCYDSVEAEREAPRVFVFSALSLRNLVPPPHHHRRIKRNGAFADQVSVPVGYRISSKARQSTSPRRPTP